ncbi:PREDICTED: uncharacterized protein LOC109159792 [Ipomoea nil]|uniref:uncharacterized protein LOC109159792 n=1 Tax=Ipomoea nil TaxID=35883 RepID=UPI000901B6A7|nr:PREDICTED: uncharacterized protein LOC109159792 [Ipomoea nil]
MVRVWRAAATALSASESVVGSRHADASPQQPLLMPTAHLCHFDASFTPTTGSTSYDAVLFSASGNFMAATNCVLSHCANPLTAESLTCKEALSWLRDHGVAEVALHTDCSVLHRYVTTAATKPRSCAGVVIDECLRFMALFNSCSLFFILRHLNLIAHTLASQASGQDSSLYWDSVPPYFVLALLN